MDNILLYASMGFIIFGFIGYFILMLFGRIMIISKCDGFDVTKDIISEYNSINIIESKSYLTIYNLKRKVIKLATASYYGKDLCSISVSLMEAGISVVDNKQNKYIDVFRIIFSNLKMLYIFPILAIVISNSSFNVNDAKVGVIFVMIFSFISYILLDIRGQASYWVSENLKKIKDISKDNRIKVIGFMNKMVLCDKIIYFGELIMIIRFALIMLDIK